MRLPYFISDEEYHSDGLGRTELKNLDSIVVLAGANGSGKSRFLSRVRDDLVNLNNQHIQKLMTAQATGITKRNSATAPEQLRQIDKKTLRRQNGIEILRHLGMEQMTPFLPIVVDFVPKHASLNDNNDFNKKTITSNADTVVAHLGVNDIQQNALSYIARLQTRWWNATHQQSPKEYAEKQQFITEYVELKEIIKAIADLDLERDVEGDITLSKQSQERLSDGQKILLQFCVLLHAQGKRLKTSIILMDEPENHLHPSAIIEVIERISKYVDEGQIWIATHSIHIISYLHAKNPNFLWFFKDGEVSKAKRIPEEVLTTLMGGARNIENLHRFVSLPTQYAAITYATQCLFAPEPSDYSSGDPQLALFREAVAKVSPDSTPTILDFGAGRGRLAYAFSESKNQFTYYAYDIQETYAKECIEAISALGVSGPEKYFYTDAVNMKEELRGKVNIILLCNVLHEISPKAWSELFSATGYLSSVLHDDGYLLVIEDQHLAVGELAYSEGFLVLDKAALEVLFKSKIEFSATKLDGRLTAYLIPKRVLGNLDDGSIYAAIQSTHVKSKTRIKEIRSAANHSYKVGIHHAFWVAQHANSSLLLDSLKPEGRT